MSLSLSLKGFGRGSLLSDPSFPLLQPWIDPPPTPVPHHRGMSILAVDPETKKTCNGVPVNLVPGLVTLGLTKIRTADPLPMISHQVETQYIASQPFLVSVSGLNISIECYQSASGR